MATGYEEHRREADAYMRTCTPNQLHNIVEDEGKRIARFNNEGDTAAAARAMRDAAVAELRSRGLT